MRRARRRPTGARTTGHATAGRRASRPRARRPGSSGGAFVPSVRVSIENVAGTESSHLRHGTGAPALRRAPRITMPPCASCRRVFGTGRRRIRTGSRARDGTRSSRPTRSRAATVCADPLGLPSEIDSLAAGRETAIVLTCPWHARDARRLAERLGAPLYAPPPDTGDPNPVDGQVFRAGDRLPVGVEAFPGMESNDLVLWVESRGHSLSAIRSSTAARASSSRPTGRTRACHPR